MPQQQRGNIRNKKRVSRPPSYATYNPDSEDKVVSFEKSDSEELYSSDFPDSKKVDYKMTTQEPSSSSGKPKLEETYPEDKKVYPEDKKVSLQEYRPPTPVFEAYPTPPSPPQVTFIRPRRLRSSCAFMCLLIALALSLTLNFIWITVALNRSIGPGIPGFGQHCDCSKAADMPSINFSPQIDLHPAQAAAEVSTVTVTSVSTFTTAMLSSTTSSASDTPTSTTVVTITPPRSTVNSTTIITVTPIVSASPHSTVYSTTVILASPSSGMQASPAAPSAAPSNTLTLQKGSIPDPPPVTSSSSSTTTTVSPPPPSSPPPTKTESPPNTQTIGDSNTTGTFLGCDGTGNNDGAMICP